MNAKPGAEIIQPPTLLRDRVSILDGIEIDYAAAENAINDMAEGFVARLPDEFHEIDAALAALEVEPEDTSCRTRLHTLVHDLKGQAGTFDYQLITDIGNDLCRFIERPGATTPRCLKVVRFHVDAMKRVAEKRMTGDGDKHGLHMIDTLRNMTRKALQA